MPTRRTAGLHFIFSNDTETPAESPRPDVFLALLVSRSEGHPRPGQRSIRQLCRCLCLSLKYQEKSIVR
jgi:hypothetical protein